MSIKVFYIYTNLFKIFGQSSHTLKVEGIDVGVLGRKLVHVGPVVGDRDHVVAEQPEQLLGDIILAERVLKGEIEQVFLLDTPIALLFLHPGTLSAH